LHKYITKFNRRSFLKSSLLTTASFSLFPALGAEEGAANKAPAPGSRPVGANGDIRFAVVGFGGRGQSHISGLGELKGMRLVALCDADSRILDREVKKQRDKGVQVEGYTDVRKLLENKDIDVVGFATPNHWHALGTIWALQAGKDVYVEKRASHVFREGRLLVEAARSHGANSANW
jgi:hypothetical protein